MRTKNLKHFLSCDRCGFDDLLCPKFVPSEVTKEDKEIQCSVAGGELGSCNSDIFSQVKTLSLDDKCVLIREILRSEMPGIKDDKSSSHLPANSTIHSIAQTNYAEWYDARFPLLRAIGDELAQGTSDYSVIREERERKLNVLTRKLNLMQSIFKLIDLNYVSPIDASSNLLHYTTSSSPLSSIVLSATSSGGGHVTAHKLIDNLLPEPDDIPGDQIEVIDNNGQDGNTYSAKTNSMKKVSLVTARLVFRIRLEGKLQRNPDLRPETYLFLLKDGQNPVVNISSNIINSQLKPSLRSQEIYKHETLRKLKMWFNEASGGFVPGKIEDTVDNLVEDISNSRKRKSESSDDGNEPKKAKYDNNESNTADKSGTSPTREQVYGRIPQNHLPKQKPLVMSPILENPNSFRSIQVVFREIQSKNQHRDWILLYVDGQPYLLGHKVILWSLICNICGAKVFRESEWTKHCAQEHPEMNNVTRRLEFGNILLLPGAGHIGMQMVKGIRKATFKVWGQVNAEALGCRSPKALLWYLNATDTHQALEHTLVEEAALGHELLAAYIKNKMEQGVDLEELSPEDFLNSWIVDQRDKCPNIKFAFDMVTKYYIAVDIFNLGVRRNNADYIQCGLDYFRDLWHVMNSPIYRPLSELFETTKTLLPKETRDFVISSQSLLTSEDLTSGQGVDFRMEECNQKIQAMLPPGAPTAQVWKRTYGNFDGLMENRDSWFTQHGLKDPRHQKNTRVRCEENLKEEIEALRVEIRKVDYFNVDNSTHNGLKGNPLHPGLSAFKDIAPQARFENLKKVVAKKSFLELSTTEHELYVEVSDERKRTQRTLGKINEIISNKIENMCDPEVQADWRRLWEPYRELNTKQAAWCFLDKLECNDKS